MANRYKKVYIHLVFAVKGRQSLLHKEWRDEVFKYLSGALDQRGHYPLAVNGWVDHVHLMFDYSLNELIPDLVREIKKSSSLFIENKFLHNGFSWQAGYGVFSVGWRDKKTVIEYIINQENHHAHKRTFKEEYLSLLNKYDIAFKNDYLFEFYD